MKKGELKIDFGIIIKICRSKLFYVNMQYTRELSLTLVEMSKSNAHKVLRHSRLEVIVAVAKVLG